MPTVPVLGCERGHPEQCCGGGHPTGQPAEPVEVQSLIHAAPGNDTLVALTAPLAIGAVALTTGVGVAAMVKAFGGSRCC